MGMYQLMSIKLFLIANQLAAMSHAPRHQRRVHFAQEKAVATYVPFLTYMYSNGTFCGDWLDCPKHLLPKLQELCTMHPGKPILCAAPSLYGSRTHRIPAQNDNDYHLEIMPWGSCSLSQHYQSAPQNRVQQRVRAMRFKHAYLAACAIRKEMPNLITYCIDRGNPSDDGSGYVLRVVNHLMIMRLRPDLKSPQEVLKN